MTTRTQLAKQTNRSFKDGDDITQLRSKIPSRKRDVNAILDGMDSILGKLISDDAHCDVPPGVDSVSFLSLVKLFKIGHEDHPDKIEEVKCPHCREIAELICGSCSKPTFVEVPNAPLVRNQLTALESVLSRTVPKLTAVTTEINIKHDLATASVEIGKIIMRYVKPENRLDALGEIRILLEGLE